MSDTTRIVIADPERHELQVKALELLARIRAYYLVLCELARVDGKAFDRVIRISHDINYDFSLVMRELGYDTDDYARVVYELCNEMHMSHNNFFVRIDATD